ncbi:hypothetical protein [Flagellimonas myxillae]|uniref:hypothetical protein n=1 Tax=Flagellimonas myxillae TaxID=2942214 RepID=UPI00201F5DBD|nr:hypothetical protein [Muricauda myxillae]MCL6265053.1 hypothetical protein [Muricauda myxillae]
MKTLQNKLYLLLLLIAAFAHGQESTKTYWAFANFYSGGTNEECRKLFMTPVFNLPKANATNYEKFEDLIKEELSAALSENNFEDESTGRIYVRTYTSEDLANEGWQQRNDREIKLALRTDYREYCEPQVLDWNYTGKAFKEDLPYSLFEDGWKKIDSIPEKISMLQLLGKLKGKTIDQNENAYTVRKRKMEIYKNGELLEYSKKTSETTAHLDYVLKANDSSILLHGKVNKLSKKLKEARPFLFNDRDVIEYLKLMVNIVHDKKNNRYTLVTQKRLFQENFALRQKELDWTFTLKDPRVLYDGKNESLISAFILRKDALCLGVFSINRVDGDIDIKDMHILKTGLDYDAGIGSENGININLSKTN